MDYPSRNIGFTTTEDGVDIAYWEIGEGKPVVILNNFGISHSELEWGVPSLASFYMEMAQRYRVIRFDPRGFGLSGDPPGGWGAETESGAQQGMSARQMGLDIEAVAAALALESFALMGLMVQGPVAIEYAATHPEVSELVLCDAMVTIATGWIGPMIRSENALQMVEDEGGGAAFTFWERIGPLEELPQLKKIGSVYAARIPPAIHGRNLLEWDAQASLADISIPTLILTTRGTAFDLLSDARGIASGINGSRLVSLEGDDRSPSPYWADRVGTLKAIDGLLEPEDATQTVAAGFRTVVFTDIVGSTEYVRRVGDEAGRATVRELEQKVASLATDHDGHVVKNLGDGSLVSFGSNSSAISFALEVQDKCSDGPLLLRIGMAAGEPLQEDGDIHGTVVAQASRIGDLGDAGEVIVSDSVRQLAAGKGFTFRPRGEVSLKGFDEPERVWKVTQTPRP